MDEMRHPFDDARRTMIEAFEDLSSLACHAGADPDAITAARGKFRDGNLEIGHAFACLAFVAEVRAL